MVDIYDEIRKRKFYLLYQKEQRLGGKTIIIKRTFRIKENQDNIFTHHREKLRMWEKNIQDFHVSSNKGPTMIRGKRVKLLISYEKNGHTSSQYTNHFT